MLRHARGRARCPALQVAVATMFWLCVGAGDAEVGTGLQELETLLGDALHGLPGPSSRGNAGNPEDGEPDEALWGGSDEGDGASGHRSSHSTRGGREAVDPVAAAAAAAEDRVLGVAEVLEQEEGTTRTEPHGARRSSLTAWTIEDSAREPRYGEEETEESMRARMGIVASDQPADAMETAGWRDTAGGWHGDGDTQTQPPLTRVNTAKERRKSRRKAKKLQNYRGDLRRGRAASVQWELAAAHHKQGNEHQARGENAQAMDLWRQSLEMFTELGMGQSVEAAYNLNNMATVEEDLQAALSLNLQALEIYRSLGLQDSTSASDTYFNIGNVYRKYAQLGGDFPPSPGAAKGEQLVPTAMRYFESAVAIREQHYGLGNRNTASTYYNMAITCKDAGMYHQAREMYAKAAEGFGQALGAADALTLNSRQWMAEMEVLLSEPNARYLAGLPGLESSLGL